MLYKPNWEEAKERYDAFWNRSSIDRPALESRRQPNVIKLRYKCNS